MLYIGAGIDYEPILQFPEIKTMYFVDCQPNYNPSFLRSRDAKEIQMPVDFFVSTLTTVWKAQGIDLVEKTDSKLVFNRNDEQTIYYYLNTIFPNDISKFDIPKDELTHICVKGFDPHSDVLLFANIDKPISFIGYHGTDYTQPVKVNTNTILNGLNSENKVIMKYFDTYVYVSKNKELTNSETWSKFLNRVYHDKIPVHKVHKRCL